jgi:branched-chain amino acid transport system substrate-binding protein
LILLIVAAGAIASGSVLYGTMSSSDSTSPSASTSVPSALPDVITIGAIFPLTGDLSTHGEESNIASRLAVSDFNSYLKDNDHHWSLKVLSEDTGTNPVIALDKLTTLHSKGVDFVVGPQSSAELRTIKGYADSNGIVLISPSSTAPALAIPDDSIFRLISDDTKQGPAIAKLLSDQGIEAIVPVWRGDTWGDGLSDTTIDSFVSMGGVVHDGIRYNPESADFSASASLLAESVSGYVEEYGADNVAVVIFSFAEVLQFMQSSAEHDILDDVRWFGGDGNTQEERLITDPIGLKFSENVSFTTTQASVMDNPRSEHVSEHIYDTVGRHPNTYAFSSYDAVWLIGLSILDTQSVDPLAIRGAIPEIASGYNGAIGSTKLNEAGDLDSADYEIWGIRNGEWVTLGQYVSTTDTIKLN